MGDTDNWLNVQQKKKILDSTQRTDTDSQTLYINFCFLWFEKYWECGKKKNAKIQPTIISGRLRETNVTATSSSFFSRQVQRSDCPPGVTGNGVCAIGVCVSQHSSSVSHLSQRCYLATRSPLAKLQVQGLLMANSSLQNYRGLFSVLFDIPISKRNLI